MTTTSSTLVSRPGRRISMITSAHGDLSMTVWSPLTLLEANAKLRQEEDITVLDEHILNVAGRGDISIRTDTIRVASNPIVEDYMSQGTIDLPNGERWPYWGIYDGHSGWYTAKLLTFALPSAITRKLSSMTDSALHDPAQLSTALEDAFVALDTGILSSAAAAMVAHRSGTISHAEALARIAPAHSGSCATLALLDPTTLQLFVACAGDSRAVLGRNMHHSDTHMRETIALSMDHMAADADEAARVTAEHPGETPINADEGRMLGCQMTRAFGNGSLKWPLEVVTMCQEEFFSKGAKDGYLSPPYMTARPVVRTERVGEGDVLILASDGFWNTMGESEDAVHCAGLWLEKEREREGSGGETKTASSDYDEQSRLFAGAEEEKGQPVAGYSYYRTTPREDFVVEDDNVATHLARNALGGADRDLFCTVMSCTAPLSRQVRDDVTIMFVRF